MMAKQQIPRPVLVWIYVVLGIKAFNLILLSVAFAVGGLPLVPQAESVMSLAVTVSFLGSTWVFLSVVPRFGLVSAAAYGGMTTYGAVVSIASGRYLLWSAVAGVTGAALIVLSFYGWPRRTGSAPAESVPAERTD